MQLVYSIFFSMFLGRKNSKWHTFQTVHLVEEKGEDYSERIFHELSFKPKMKFIGSDSNK